MDRKKEGKTQESRGFDSSYDKDFLELKKIYSDFKQRYKVSALEILDKLEEKEVFIPISIFNERLSALETIVKYLKENVNLKNKEIGKITGRSSKVVWQAYDSSRKKYVKKFEFNQYGSGIPGKAFDEFKIIKLGEENFDAAALAETPIRDIDNGLQVIDHEFIHILDRTVSEQESSMLNTRKEQRMNSPEIAEKAEKRRKELIAMYEKQESEGQISKNMADSLRRGIDSLLEMEIYWDNEAQHEILNRKNKEIIISLVDGLYADEQFNKVLDEIMEFNSKKKISVLYVDLLKKDIGDKSPPATQKYDNVRLISRTEAELKLNSIKHNKDTSSEDRRRAAELVAGLNKAIADTTGLYPYSFEGGARNNFLESLSTYSELPPERARKNPGLAQLEYDKAMSADPPEWLRQKAEKRYYGIMGGKDGAYCKANPCGPCLIYKLTCRPAAAAQ